MSSHPFDKLSLKDGSAVIFTPCPGTKDASLRDSLAQLAQAGAKAVITLMPDDEMIRNEVTELPDACNEKNLHWFHFPIEDNASPGEEFQQAWEKDKERVFAMLNQQEALAVHCKGGSGRTGLMVAIILLERGMPYEQAVAQVKLLRPNALKLAVHTDYLAQNYGGGSTNDSAQRYQQLRPRCRLKLGKSCGLTSTYAANQIASGERSVCSIKPAVALLISKAIP